MCLRWVNDSLKIDEAFLAMFTSPDSTAEALFKVTVGALETLTLDVINLRGHCFDGAPNMSGNVRGLQRRITDLQPMSTFVHCPNYALDLCLQEVARNTDLVGDTICTVKDVSNMILRSHKRKQTYLEVVPPSASSSSVEQVTSNLLPLRPTRWTVRVKSMKRFDENYERVQETLSTILSENSVSDD